MNKRLLAQLAVLALAAAGTVAHADTVEDKFQVTMQITSVCNIVNTHELKLGQHVAGAENDPRGATKLEISCSKGTPFLAHLLPSSDNVQGVGEMKGQKFGDTIPYALFRDSNLSTPWGAKDFGVKGEGRGMTQPLGFEIHAQAKGTDYAPDTYVDTVRVLVEY